MVRMLVPLPKPPAVLRMEMHLRVLECFAWDVEQFDRVPSVAKKMLVVIDCNYGVERKLARLFYRCQYWLKLF
jgi:hypothetical protein